MRRYGIIGTVLFFILILFGILLLFGTGSDLAITLILFLIPLMIIVSFLIIYIAEVRRKSVRTQVLERDLRRIAYNLIELIKRLSSFEDQYHIVTRDFKTELMAVEKDLASIGCIVDGKVRFDRVKFKRARSADIEEIQLKIDGIRKRYEPTIYGKVIERGEDYLDRLKALEGAGYRKIHDEIARMEMLILEDIDIDILSLTRFMEDLTSIFDEAIGYALREIKEAESGSKTLRDRSRIRTDIKLAEQNREQGKFENAVSILKNAMVRLIDETADHFNQDKEKLQEMIGILKKITDNASIHEIEEKIELTDSPSQQKLLTEYEEALKGVALEILSDLYVSIFDIEANIRLEEPSSADYPVDYWDSDRMKDIEDLQSMESLDKFMQRYEARVQDADSRLKYDSDRMTTISKKNLSN